MADVESSTRMTPPQRRWTDNFRSPLALMLFFGVAAMLMYSMVTEWRSKRGWKRREMRTSGAPAALDTSAGQS